MDAFAQMIHILKVLHQKGILRSVRGASGGYQIACDLSTLTLLDLSNLLDNVDSAASGDSVQRLALHGPAQALQYRLVRFMRDVSVADLVLPGRRIDVPLERVGVNQKNRNRRSEPVLIGQT